MDVIHYWQMNEQLNLYAIPITITNPDTGASLIKSCVFDTGYSGYLGLDFETINHLGLEKVGEAKDTRLAEKLNRKPMRELLRLGTFQVRLWNRSKILKQNL